MPFIALKSYVFKNIRKIEGYLFFGNKPCNIISSNKNIQLNKLDLL